MRLEEACALVTIQLGHVADLCILRTTMGHVAESSNKKMNRIVRRSGEPLYFDNNGIALGTKVQARTFESHPQHPPSTGSMPKTSRLHVLRTTPNLILACFSLPAYGFRTYCRSLWPHGFLVFKSSFVDDRACL